MVPRLASGDGEISPSRPCEDGHNGPVTRVLIGLIVLGNLALGPAAAAAPASCGAPDQAPGFERRAERRVMPDVGCMDLQLAQDKVQAAGFYRVASRDASGQRRRQVDDRNWVVVSQTPAPGTRTRSPRIVLQVLAYGDPGAPSVPDRSRPGRMPNLMCFDLQEAQDTLQSAGFFNMGSEDATGRRRRQFVDRNWTVTDQSPSPGGTHRKNARVTLRVVKDREPSPC
jgi:beta-lactam-binding protein with PASTA domain